MAHLTISATVAHYPELPYAAIVDAILPKSYELSLVIVGEQRARTVNQTARGKDYVPDVLSFPLTSRMGEIYLCLPKAYADAPQYSHTPVGHTGFLLIHGLLHLKGYEHGATMERAERRYCSLFNLT